MCNFSRVQDVVGSLNEYTFGCNNPHSMVFARLSESQSKKHKAASAEGKIFIFSPGVGIGVNSCSRVFFHHSVVRKHLCVVVGEGFSLCLWSRSVTLTTNRFFRRGVCGYTGVAVCQ